MIIEEGSFRVAVGVDVQDAVFTTHGRAAGEVPAAGTRVDAVRRAVVEVHRRVGGLPQHALLGGTLHTPRSEGRFTVEVALSGATSTTPVSCHGSLGRDLIPGLPDEFGGAVVSGILGWVVRPGNLIIDRGAYHPVESSRLAFSLAGLLLAVVLGCDRADEVEASVRARLAALG